MFILSYIGYDRWLQIKWVRVLLWIIPTSNVILVLTNEWHGLFWSGFTRSPVGDNILTFHHGPGFFWTVLNGYIAAFIIFVSLTKAIRKSSELVRRQARLLLIALIIPLAGNLLYLLEIPEIQGIDWSSVLFSVSGIFFLAALYGTRFLTIVPIARHAMIEWMTDCVLVLDANNRVTDFNQATQINFGIAKRDLGKPVDIAMVHWPKIIELSSLVTTNRITIKIGKNKKTLQYFDTHLTLLEDNRGQLFGKLIVFRNITKYHQAERALEQRFVDIQELNENLRQSQEQIVAQQRELAKTEERQRMARDLHDSASQSIHSMVLFSETLAATLEKGNLERARQIIERLQESARQSHKETRLLLYELQAKDLERSVDIIQDLETRLAMVERHAGLNTQLIREGSLENCPPDWHRNLFWITIEALNNALRHAQARSVKIILRCTPGEIKLEIVDDGIGFDSSKVVIGGMGLKNLHERAGLIGGTLTIESKLNRGTRVLFNAKIKVD